MPNFQHDTQPPSNWPADVIYLSKQRYASRLPSALQYKVLPKDSVPTPLTRCRMVKIQVITSPTHPAKGQRGLFAAQKIPPATHVLDYLGEVHSDDRPDSDYDLSLLRLTPSELLELGLGDEAASIGVDAQRMGNEARFINDYRGTGVAKPNAEFRDTIVGEELRMSVWSGAKGINKGEEILVSYGKSWWNARSEDN